LDVRLIKSEYDSMYKFREMINKCDVLPDQEILLKKVLSP